MNPLPAGPFGVILADPPWRFATYSPKGQEKSPERHYPTMTMAEVRAMPVAEVAAKDCALFLWCTWPTIFEAKAVMEAWGFTYSGLAWEWFKVGAATWKPAFGPGYGTRKNVEPCLLARRGSPRCISRSERDWLIAPRREHSRKPDDQYDRIGRMYPDGDRLELFARTERPGWTAWGNQTDRFP